MSNVRRKIAQKKQDYDVFKYTVKTDRYGNESYDYSSAADFQINVMWCPVSSEVEITEYGERVNEMLNAVLYTNENVVENDRVCVNGNMYNVVSCKPYPSYRQLLIERVK